jgi:hypothetical protein
MTFAPPRPRPHPDGIRGPSAAPLLLAAAAWLAGSVFAPPAGAEETPSSYGAPAKVDAPILRLPLMRAAPTIDGAMQKGEWDDSSSLSAFFYDYGLADFRFMAPPQTQLEVYGGYDRDHLYLAFVSPVFPVNAWFKARGRFPDVLTHPLYGILWDDKLELELRPHDDLAEGFRLGLFRWDVNPIGTFADWYWSQQTGQDFKWKSNATIRSRLERDKWTVEFKIPFAGFRHGNYAAAGPPLASPPADGTVLRTWLVRGIGGCGDFFNCFDAHVWNTTKTQLILDSQAPSFQVNDLGPILEDAIDLRLTVKNHATRSETVRVGFFVESAEGPVYSSYDSPEIPGGLVELRPGELKQLRLRQPFPGISRDGNVLWFDVRSEGQPAKTLYRTRLTRFHSLEGGEKDGLSFRARRLDVIEGMRPPRKDFEFTFQFSPRRKRAAAVVDRGIHGARDEVKGAVEAKLTIMKNNDDEDVVAEQRAPFNGNFATFLLDLPQLTEGESYKANLLLFDASKRIIGEEDKPPFAFRKERWHGTTIGLEDEVWDPFTPLDYSSSKPDGQVVATLAHRIALDASGLPAQLEIRADPRDLPLEARANPAAVAAEELVAIGRGPQFRGPVRLEAVVDGKRVQAKAIEPAKPVRQGKSEAEYRAKLEVGPLEAVLTTRYDCDGSLHASLAYTGKKAKLDSLELVADVAGPVDLCLSETGNGGMTGADRWECTLPPGPGVVWDSRVTGMELSYNKFVPWFWFGSADRAWSWYCDSDSGWLLDREGTSMRLERDDTGAVTWRVLFVNHPTEVEGTRTIDFSLLTHPAKPKPAKHRLDAWHHYIGPGWATGYMQEPLELSEEYLTKRWRAAASAPADWPDEKRAEWRKDEAPHHRYGRWRNAAPDYPTAELDFEWEEKATYFFEQHVRIGRRVGWWMDEYFPVVFGRSDNLAAGNARLRSPAEVEGDELPWQPGFLTTPMRNHYKRMARVFRANNVPQRQHTWSNNASSMLESTVWSSLMVEECGAGNRAYEVDTLTQFPNSLYRFMGKNWTGLVTAMCADFTPCMPGDDKRLDRQRLGLGLLHDFGVVPNGPHGTIAHKEQGVRLLRELERFGVFDDATVEKLPFWRNGAIVAVGPDENPAAKEAGEAAAQARGTAEVRVTAYRRPLAAGPDGAAKGTGVLFVVLNETLHDCDVPLVVRNPGRLGGAGSLRAAAVLGELAPPAGFADWWQNLVSRDGEAVVLRDIESGDVVERKSTGPDGETYGPIHVPAHDYRVFYGVFGG